MIRALRPILAPAVRNALADRFSRREAREVLEVAFADYAARRSSIPPEPELGGRLMVHLAALTAGLYRALRARGVSDEDARRLTADATWRVYEKMAAVPWLLARMTERTPYRRLWRATQVFRRFRSARPATS